MTTNTNDTLAKKILELEGDVAGSFIGEKLDLSETVISDGLHNAEFEFGNLIACSEYPARQFSVLIDNQEKVIVKPGIWNETEVRNGRETFTVKVFPYLAQTSLGFYLLAMTKFDIFNYVNREPTAQEKALESFHSSLKKSLGLAFGMAYFGNEVQEMSADERKSSGIVAVIKTQFRDISIGDFISIVFTL